MKPPPRSMPRRMGALNGARDGGGSGRQAVLDANEEARLRQLKADISALVTRATEQQAALATERADVERAIAQLAASQSQSQSQVPHPLRPRAPSPSSSRSITPTPRRPQPGRTPSRLRVLRMGAATGSGCVGPPSRPSSAPPPYSAAVAATGTGRLPPASPASKNPRRPPAVRKSSSSRRFRRPGLGQRKSSEQSSSSASIFGKPRGLDDPSGATTTGTAGAADARAARALWASLFLPRHEAYPARGTPVWGGSLDTYAIEMARGGLHAATTFPLGARTWETWDEPGPTSDWGESDSDYDDDDSGSDSPETSDGAEGYASDVSHDTVCYRRERDPFQGDQCGCSSRKNERRRDARGRGAGRVGPGSAAGARSRAPHGFRDARLGLFCPWCARNGHTEANCHDKAQNRPSWAARRQTFIAARDAAQIRGRPHPTALMEPWPLKQY